MAINSVRHSFLYNKIIDPANVRDPSHDIILLWMLQKTDIYPYPDMAFFATHFLGLPSFQGFIALQNYFTNFKLSQRKWRITKGNNLTSPRKTNWSLQWKQPDLSQGKQPDLSKGNNLTSTRETTGPSTILTCSPSGVELMHLYLNISHYPHSYG